jgi:hypothetical protein
MICLTCGHYATPDGEMERAQGSGACPCRCHPWNRPPDPPSRPVSAEEFARAADRVFTRRARALATLQQR